MTDISVSDFVEQTLLQIVEGTVKAQHAAKKHGALINPTNQHWEKVVRDIEFNIEVTTDSSKKKEGGAGIAVASFRVGGSGEVIDRSNSVASIKFSVPLLFPFSTYDTPKK